MELFFAGKNCEQSLESDEEGEDGFEFIHYNDTEARAYVYEKAGDVVGAAYDCIRAPAYRGDLFRFVSLYHDGGIYLDSDIVPLVPLSKLYSPCSDFTLGHDIPQGSWDENDEKFSAAATRPIRPPKCGTQRPRSCRKWRVDQTLAAAHPGKEAR